MIKISNLSKEFVDKKILTNINLFIGPTDKAGLIGVNGTGKSTFLKILVKKEAYEQGTISIAPHTSITYLSQELPEFKQRLLLDEVKNTFPGIVNRQNELADLEEKMNLETDNKELEAIVERYSQLQEELNHLDVRGLEVEMYKVLKGLGFTEADFEREIGEFSGGWQMRIALAKLLLQKPNLLLLDEPTNHLDIEAIEWLEEYLRNYSGAVILVSHDRRFLDRVVSRIIELENTQMEDYPGNYTFYEREKQRRLEALISEKERQDKEIKKMQDFVDRFRASANRSTQAKSREKMLDKIERIELPKTAGTIKFSFPMPPASGRIVLKLKNLAKSFSEKVLFDFPGELWVERGEKIAILGPNGAGKTTLFRLITGEEKVDRGESEIGHNVFPAYFAQNQAEKLNSENLVIDEIYDLVPDYTLTKVRSLLGRFLFTGEKAFQLIASLSGGEKSRLAMAKMLLSPANLLLLDEPTNHLDLPSKEVLISALQEFPETFMVISHDRDFISRTCTKIWEVNNRQITIYDGNYDYYLEKKGQNKVEIKQKETEKNEKTVQVSKEYRMEQKERQKLLLKVEKNILKIEERLKILDNDLADPQIYDKSELIVKINTEYSQLKAELDEQYTKWEELTL